MIAASAVTDIYKLRHPAFQGKWLVAVNVVSPVLVLIYLMMILKRKANLNKKLKAEKNERFWQKLKDNN